MFSVELVVFCSVIDELPNNIFLKMILNLSWWVNDIFQS